MKPKKPYNARLVDFYPGLRNRITKLKKETGEDIITKRYGDEVLMIWPHILNVNTGEDE